MDKEIQNYREIQKSRVLSIYSTLEKAGEGSRGGKVIGHTKSGKAVYDDRKANRGWHIGDERHNENTTGIEMEDREYPIYKFRNKEERDSYLEKEGGIFHPKDETKAIMDEHHHTRRVISELPSGVFLPSNMQRDMVKDKKEGYLKYKENARP